MTGHFYSPTSSSLIFKTDIQLYSWYERKKNSNESFGRAIAISACNFGIATLGTIASLVYDLSLTILWGLVSIVHKNAMPTFFAHVRSLGNIPSNALNHFIGIIPPLAYRAFEMQLFQYVEQVISLGGSTSLLSNPKTVASVLSQFAGSNLVDLNLGSNTSNRKNLGRRDLYS